VSLGNVTGVLSRYFIVGFWIPTFFSLVILGEWLSDGWTPSEYDGLDWNRKILVLGGLALAIGLLLLGLRYPIVRALEGYGWSGWPLLGSGLTKLQQRSYDKYARIRDDENASSGAQTRAARLLERKFPHDGERVLPTAFGNAFRAFENYPYTRYGLDMIAIWPRIDQLLTDQERNLHVNAESDEAFFVNGMIGSFVVGVLFAADAELPWWPYPIPFLFTFALYRASIGAVERVGTERRASADLHRLELYDRLGMARPAGSDADRKESAGALNRFVLWGDPIPAQFLKKTE
jgi:hypothetical protein